MKWPFKRHPKTEETDTSGLVGHSRSSAKQINQLLEIILLLATAVVIAVFTKSFIIQPYVVDGESMETTLQNNDRLLVDKLPRTFARLSNHQYIPHRGDIIIFNQSGLPGYAGPKQLIKRVVALPGERVLISDGVMTVYNSAQPKGFNPDTVDGYHNPNVETVGNVDLTLGATQVFVLGDNRDNSEDSRYFGGVDSQNIVGKLVLRVFPINKAQRF